MLKNQTALVTGSNRGIGKVIALTFAKNGANIVVNYVGEANKAEALDTVEEIKALGVEAIAIDCNVVDNDAVVAMIKEIKTTFGTLDIVVNNAGITRDKLLISMKEEDFDSVINVNLKGTFLVSKAASKLMIKQRKGSIINISSVIGVVGNAGQANYAASKAGIIGFTKSLAKELASRNIRANAICPGFIQTKMTDVLSDEIKKSMEDVIALKRLGNPEDVANAALFLASEQSSYITGQALNVCGGMVM